MIMVMAATTGDGERNIFHENVQQRETWTPERPNRLISDRGIRTPQTVELSAAYTLPDATFFVGPRLVDMYTATPVTCDT